MKKEISVSNNKFLGGPPIFWFTNKETVLQKCLPNKLIQSLVLSFPFVWYDKNYFDYMNGHMSIIAWDFSYLGFHKNLFGKL
jgi:hypothetical protein